MDRNLTVQIIVIAGVALAFYKMAPKGDSGIGVSRYEPEAIPTKVSVDGISGVGREILKYFPGFVPLRDHKGDIVNVPRIDDRPPGSLHHRLLRDRQEDVRTTAVQRWVLAQQAAVNRSPHLAHMHRRAMAAASM